MARGPVETTRQAVELLQRQLEGQVTDDSRAADMFAEVFADEDPERLAGLTVGLVNLSQILVWQLSELTRQPPTKLLEQIAAGLAQSDDPD